MMRYKKMLQKWKALVDLNQKEKKDSNRGEACERMLKKRKIIEVLRQNVRFQKVKREKDIQMDTIGSAIYLKKVFS